MLLHLLLKHENCRSSEIAKYKCDLQYFYNLVQHTTHQNLINGWKINKSVPKNIITTCIYIHVDIKKSTIFLQISFQR